jgi:hypothetical protein
MKSSVKIGPSFFSKAKNDYADWRWAWVRELAQNSMDAPGTTKIEFEFSHDGNGNTVASCRNDGTPMDQETLTNKFLSIGESGKSFQGTVGGFGKAKELIAFCHNSYRIHTGNLLVVGEGAEYELTETESNHGTKTTVVMSGDQTNYLQESVRKFASYAQWDGVIVLNGERLECKLKKGSPRREFKWGTVYTNKSIPHRVIVRVNGIPMFSHWTELDRTVIIELKGASVDVLTSNRDGLVYRYEDEFDTFLSDLITNKSKALKAQNPTYTHFSGAKFKANPERKSTANARSIVGDTAPVLAAFAGASAGASAGAPAVTTGGESVLVSTGRIGVMEGTAGPVSVGPVSVGPVSVISEEFVLKNETTLKIPDYYQPDSDQFGSYSKKLARMWGRLVLELHRMYSLEQEFAIGFVFSDDAEAQYERTREYGVVYYLNPAIIVEQQNSASKSFKKRFQLSERDRLLAIAVHEFVHGLGFSSHSEDFACKLTEVTGRVLTHARKGGFSWCYR